MPFVVLCFFLAGGEQPRTVEISSVTIEAEAIQPTSATAIPDFLKAVGMTIPHVSSLRGGHGDPLEMMVERSNVSDDNVARMALDREIDERSALSPISVHLSAHLARSTRGAASFAACCARGSMLCTWVSLGESEHFYIFVC